MVAQMPGIHAQEIAKGERFEFGANWRRFLQLISEPRIQKAQRSLLEMLELNSLEGKRFLDIGCGSGLFSLAAQRAGAEVHSFDLDPQAVACTRELQHRFGKEIPRWAIEAGSVLDQHYVTSLGLFDIVYSWGVLHHTGAMWTALENAAVPVANNGLLYIAIYDDARLRSRMWVHLKRWYNHLPRLVRLPYALMVSVPRAIDLFLRALLLRDSDSSIEQAGGTDAGKERGMSLWHDMIDWVGGYPYEFAKPDQVFDFYRRRGFHLVRLKTVGGDLACNEFVFQRGETKS